MQVFRNKKGVNDKTYFMLFEIVLVILVFVVLFLFIKGSIESTYFERVYHSKNFAVIMDVMYGTPGDIHFEYKTKTDKGLSLAIYDGYVGVFASDNPDSEIKYRFLYDIYTKAIKFNVPIYPYNEIIWPAEPSPQISKEYQEIKGDSLIFSNLNKATCPKANTYKELNSVNLLIDPWNIEGTGYCNGLLCERDVAAAVSESFRAYDSNFGSVTRLHGGAGGVDAYISLHVLNTSSDKNFIKLYIPSKNTIESRKLACLIQNSILTEFSLTSPTPFCGDNEVNQDWELCDGESYCNRKCHVPLCGNGEITEQCECDGSLRQPGEGYCCLNNFYITKEEGTSCCQSGSFGQGCDTFENWAIGMEDVGWCGDAWISRPCMCDDQLRWDDDPGACCRSGREYTSQPYTGNHICCPEGIVERVSCGLELSEVFNYYDGASIIITDEMPLSSIGVPGVHIELANIQNEKGANILNNPNKLALALSNALVSYFNYTSCLEGDGCKVGCPSGDPDCECLEQSTIERPLAVCDTTQGQNCHSSGEELFSNQQDEGISCCTSTCCGNGVAEGDESCDLIDLRGKNCQVVGFEGGSLSCTSKCYYDMSGCTN